MALQFVQCKNLVEGHFGPGESDFIDDRGERALLTNICLHLVNGTKLEDLMRTIHDEDDDVVRYRNDIFFAEHFLFHNIPKRDFEGEIKNFNSLDDVTKVTEILNLIDNKIRKPTKLRFHEFYDMVYHRVLANNLCPNDQKKKFLCNVLLELLTKATAQKKDLISNNDCFASWDTFYASCITFNIDLSLNIKKGTDAYLALLQAEQKTLSSAASKKAIQDKITVLQNLQNILANPKLDEKNKALVTFIQNNSNIQTLNQRRYVSRGLLHAGEVFIKSLLVFAALIVDIATLAAIKLITGTSLTARAHARFFPVRGEKLADSLIEHCTPLLKA